MSTPTNENEEEERKEIYDNIGELQAPIRKKVLKPEGLEGAKAFVEEQAKNR